MKNVNKTDPTVLVKVKDLFELKNFALSKIKIIKKPVTHTEILFYYSAYFYHFDSLVDFMKDRFSKNFTEKMEKSFGSNNREFLSKLLIAIQRSSTCSRFCKKFCENKFLLYRFSKKCIERAFSEEVIKFILLRMRGFTPRGATQFSLNF